MEQQFTEREQWIIDRGGWDPECSYCQKAGRPGGYFPPHTALSSCQSGKRNHCSCSACF
jgi:hypothetical protein